MKRVLPIAVIAFALSTIPALAGETPAPEGASVYFANLLDGQKVISPVTIIFGLRGMGVAPAGTEKENTGHHHLFINRPPLGQGEEGDEEYDLNIPSDENHIHFGGGQTEIELDLPAGEHTLQLVLGDKDHIPHHPPVVSEQITIIVEE